MAGEDRPFVAKKSFKDGYVGISVTLRSRGYYLKVQANENITTEEARVLAAALIEQADAADAKVAKKAAAEERRQKWRDREVAAGRLRVMSVEEFFGR